jgi:hypothetical protein
MKKYRNLFILINGVAFLKIEWETSYVLILHMAFLN